MRASGPGGRRRGTGIPQRWKSFSPAQLGHHAPVLATLDHVVVAVGDLAAATARDRAAARSRARAGAASTRASAPPTRCSALDNTYLELLAPAAPGPSAEVLRAPARAQRGEGLFALAFGTPDAEACRATLAARGLEPGPVTKGLGRDIESGAFREWRSVLLPAGAHPRRAALRDRAPLAAGPAARSSRPLGAAAAAPHALDHVVVRSADPEASRRAARRRARPPPRPRPELRGLRPPRALLPPRRRDAGGRGLARRSRRTRPRRTCSGASPGRSPTSRPRARASRSAGFDVSPVRAGRKPGTVGLHGASGTCGVPTLLIGPAPAA